VTGYGRLVGDDEMLKWFGNGPLPVFGPETDDID
jgi:hypothetical protein